MIQRLARMANLLTRQGGIHARQAVSFYTFGKLSGQKANFAFEGREYPYFLHRYNHTWLAERTVEIPLARTWLEQQQRRQPEGHVLEVGHVLAHYQPVEHDVVDLYEQAEDVINQDIADFRPTEPSRRYHAILSISTLEHIGENEADTAKRAAHVQRAQLNLAHLLSAGGELLATLPLGVATPLRSEIEQAALGQPSFFTRVAFLRRLDANNNWLEATWEEVQDAAYDHPYPAANALALCWRQAE